MSNIGNQMSDLADKAKQDPQHALNQGKNYMSEHGENLKTQASKAGDNLPGGGSGNGQGGIGEQAQNAINQAKESLGLGGNK